MEAATGGLQNSSKIYIASRAPTYHFAKKDGMCCFELVVASKVLAASQRQPGCRWVLLSISFSVIPRVVLGNEKRSAVI